MPDPPERDPVHQIGHADQAGLQIERTAVVGDPRLRCAVIEIDAQLPGGLEGTVRHSTAVSVAALAPADHIFLGKRLAARVVSGKNRLADLRQMRRAVRIVGMGIVAAAPEGFLIHLDDFVVVSAVHNSPEPSAADGIALRPNRSGLFIEQFHSRPFRNRKSRRRGAGSYHIICAVLRQQAHDA